MKGLKGYIMHLKKSLKKIIVGTFISSVALSTVFAKEEILSQKRLELFNLSEKKAIEDASKLRKDWINPITYRLSRTHNEEYNPLVSTIQVNQSIFKSGGIYQAIQYANASERYAHLDIEIQKKQMIKEALELLYAIHRLDYTIKKQELLIKNANIDVLRKKEQVLSGILDASFLDNAILDANARKNELASLQYERKSLILNFNNLASGAYEEFELPTFKLIAAQEYLDKNLFLQQGHENVDVKSRFSVMTIAKYLPTLNVTYDYTYYHDKDNNPQLTSQTKDYDETIGMNITIPLDIRTFNDIQSQRIAYLQSKIELNNQKLEEENFYKAAHANIEMIEQKQKIAQEDYKLYGSLLDDITQAANAGLNAPADVQTLENSKQIKSYDIKILELEKQSQLLQLYAKVNSEW
jgi:outer membrane protein TolC